MRPSWIFELCNEIMLTWKGNARGSLLAIKRVRNEFYPNTVSFEMLITIYKNGLNLITRLKFKIMKLTSFTLNLSTLLGVLKDTEEGCSAQ